MEISMKFLKAPVFEHCTMTGIYSSIILLDFREILVFFSMLDQYDYNVTAILKDFSDSVLASGCSL